MTIIFPVLCQELLKNRAVIQTDGKGWQLHTRPISHSLRKLAFARVALCAASASTCARPRAPVPPGPGPKRKPRNARSHAWRLVSRSKLLASWLSPKFWTPECQRLSASPVSAHRLVSLFLNGLRFCLAGAQSTEEAAALAALLQYLGPEEATVNQSPCAAQPPWPLFS